MLVLVLVLVCIVALPLNAAAPATENTGPYLWSLDSKNDKNAQKLPALVSLMEKNYGPGDNGQSGKVTIAAGKSYIWVSDQSAQANIAVPSGAWVLQIVTDTDWGTRGNKCRIEIGEWNGSFKSLTPLPQTIKSDISTTVIIKTLFQNKSLTIHKNTHLALKVTNLEITRGHVIYTGEKEYCSFLRSPETYTTSPLPELASGILLTIGLAGLGTFIIIRRRYIKIYQ